MAIIEETVEIIRTRPALLPPEQRSTIVLELTPFISRNNRPNKRGATVCCISLLRRLANAGVDLPDRPEAKSDRDIMPVSAGVSARVFHALKSGEDIIVQGSVKAATILHTAVRASRDGHELHIVYTDALEYVDVPEAAASEFRNSLVRLQRRVLNSLPLVDSLSVIVTPAVSYRDLKYHGQSSMALSNGSNTLQMNDRYRDTWVEFFDRALCGDPHPRMHEHLSAIRIRTVEGQKRDA